MRSFRPRIILAVLALIVPVAGYPDRPDFAQEPLFIGSSVAPNLMFILDDSGSMGWGFIPDSIAYANGISWRNGRYSGTNAQNRYYYSSYINKIWYNPDVTYLPPWKPDGSGRYPDSSYTSAPENGYDDGSNTHNLSNRFYVDGYQNDYVVRDGGFYYVFNNASGCTANPYQNKCYDYVSVNDLSEEEQTNFANWYSYYNNRVKAARAGISSAFYDLPTSFRLGWGRINKGTSSVDDASNIRAVVEGVRAYSNDWREEFLEWLYDAPSSGSTPLRRALEGAGEYYKKSERAWADNPGSRVSDTNPVRECRQAYTILMSDGYYNGSSPDNSLKKADDKEGDQITNDRGDSYQYTPVDPFKDGYNGTSLADVAMYYWKTDLRSDIDNYVPTSDSNPAFWQHMVTYTVGLGVNGTIDPNDAFAAIESGESIDWWGGDGDEDKINDMLHAAVNGRGGFFSASDPETFAAELKKTVDEIVAEAGSATAVEFDVSSFQEGAMIFSTQFDPNGWTGDLKAAELEGSDTPVVPDFDDAIESGNGWSAKTLLDNRDLSTNDRVILTYNGTAATGFRWDNLTNTQQDDLRYGGVGNTVAQQRLEYIRGDRSLEGTSGWRKRGSRLGSIVNSSPEYVGSPDAIWPDSDPFGTASERYSDFAKDKENRTPVIYVGSNDGMLHGFDASESGGEELLAYIPGFVYNWGEDNAGLHFLTDPDYQHRYYVDLSIRQQDIYSKGKNVDGSVTGSRDWRSIIVGGGRAGAKGIFALDVTDPSDFSEANAGKIALWEFSGDDDARMGYVIQAPIIAMTKWGADDIRWTAFVANGYNSDSASTGFFMLDIEGGMDGSWDSDDVRYVEFESGGDGLSPLLVLDTTGDYLADRVYAGDLDGNLWVATVDTSGNWASAYKSGGVARPLFTAADNQPITSAPAATSNDEVSRAGNTPNLLIYFGTGQYLESDDVTSTDTQTIYGVWDRGSFGLDRSDLQDRTVTEGTMTQTDGTISTVRYSDGDVIDYASVKGWYVDLPDSGERVVTSPQIYGDFLYINTLIPDQDPCLGGGSGWLMALGLDGRTPTERAFLSFPDEVAGYMVSGLPNESTILGNYRFTSTSNVDEPVDTMELPPLSGAVTDAGRRGWVELIDQ